MNSRRIQRLTPLVNLAQKSVNEALQYIGTLQTRIQEEENRKVSLDDYRDEYQNNFKNQGKTGIRGTEAHQFEGFLLQIDAAMHAENRQIKMLTEQLAKAQKVHAQLNQRLKIYKKLETRLTDQKIASENQQLQKLLDELGNLLYGRHDQIL